jgi:hypothetical protein
MTPSLEKSGRLVEIKIGAQTFRYPAERDNLAAVEACARQISLLIPSSL